MDHANAVTITEPNRVINLYHMITSELLSAGHNTYCFLLLIFAVEVTPDHYETCFRPQRITDCVSQ